MKTRNGRLMVIAGLAFSLFVIIQGCTHLNSGRESGGSEGEKKAGGKILCVDEEGMQVSFSNFWRAVKNAFKQNPTEEK